MEQIILSQNRIVGIEFDPKESEAVRIAIENLKRDLFKAAHIQTTDVNKNGRIIIGTIGISEEVTKYFDATRLQDESGTYYKEAYLQKAQNGRIIIAGTDRRGTIYGIYDFCEWIGVSPWYFWADVPVKEKDRIVLREGYQKIDYPSVEYRGIFINDEEELEKWTKLHMGEDTIGVRTYEKVFELLLRLKANYIWPAMHVNSFNIKRENGALADRMGIVVGTSHCDMLMRSNNREWIPWINRKGYQDAQYDYSIEGRNREILQEYWRESVEQNQEFEVCYTLGMRGIHDSGFETEELLGKTEEEIRQAKVKLLETIIADQMGILEDTLHKDVMKTFVPYKEVLELYDNGLRIPEELTLIWANDNYGYIRRYPSKEEQKRKGGNGIYYHNSYWAPPGLSYLFINSIPLAHTKNELTKAYEEGIRKLWVMNVGAMKPLEQEITFFTRLAWEIGKENVLTEDVDEYLADFIDRSFSGGIGEETAGILNDFTQLTNVRKIENLDYDVFYQTAYGDEAAVRMNRYQDLFDRANQIYNDLPEREKCAFYQIVLMKIHAAYYTNGMYYFADRSALCNKQGKMQAAALYTKYSIMLDDIRRKMLYYYNEIMAAGKWKGILTPEDFPPPRTAMHPACMPPLAIGERKMLVSIWNDNKEITFVRPTDKWIEIANAGAGEFEVLITAPDWLNISEKAGVIQTEKRVFLSPINITADCEGLIAIRNITDDEQMTIPVRIKACDTQCPNLEDDGILPVPADTGVEVDGVTTGRKDENDSEASTGWYRIKRLGRNKGALMEARKEGAVLAYPVYFTGEGEFLLEIQRFPSLNSTGRIRVGVSMDEAGCSKQRIQILESDANDEWRGNWRENVLNNADKLYCRLPYAAAGLHTVRIHAVDKYFSFSKLVIYTKERKANSLGGATGDQKIPNPAYLKDFSEEFYGKIDLRPRYITYARTNQDHDSLTINSIRCQARTYAQQTTPAAIMEKRNDVFRESTGCIKIDAICALAQTKNAYTENGEWQYCNSESYGRSGLSLYIKEHKVFPADINKAPSLNYRILTEGGDYTVWLLTKLDSRDNSRLAMGLDQNILEQDTLYGGGILWRYEAEQIWRWVPVTKLIMEKGQHLLQIYALSSGMRYDRIYLTQGEELPPEDLIWE